jgi:hypothetical protein
MAELVERLWRWTDRLIQRFLVRSGSTKVWNWQKAERSTLARFVSVGCAAAELGPLELIDGRTVHDVREDPGGPSELAEAAFDHIRTQEIWYDKEGYTPEGEETQRIRTPIEMVDRKTGTCLDLALLYAGYLMNLHVRPLVVVLEGHALVAVVAAQFPLSIPGAETDGQRLRQWLDDGTLIPVECTGFAVGDGITTDFETAVANGRSRITDGSVKFFIDPWHLQRRGGLRPHHCQKLSPAKVGALGTATVGIAAAGAVLLWPGPDALKMPASDGRNIALFPLETRGDTTPLEGETVAEELATTLRMAFDDAGELRSNIRSGWTVWGPGDLAMTQPPPADPERLEAEMRDRNIDIAIYGTLDSVDGRRFPQIRIWFRPSARGVKEAGVTGGVVLASDEFGTTASLGRIASELSDESDAWFQILQGLGLLHDARSRDELLEVRRIFDQATESTSGDTRALARLFTGGTHLYIDATFNPDDEVARTANAQLASQPLEAVLNDGSLTATELRARAAIGLAQVELNVSGCNPEDPQPAGLDRAEGFMVQSGAALTDRTSPIESELLFRRRVMEGRIAFCRWRSGLGATAAGSTSDSGPAVGAEGAAARAERVLTEAIDDYQARTDQEDRARVRFPAADAYGLRGQLTATDDPEAALADLVAARCLARPFSEDFWATQQDRLQQANPAIEHEGGCRALAE